MQFDNAGHPAADLRRSLAQKFGVGGCRPNAFAPCPRASRPRPWADGGTAATRADTFLHASATRRGEEAEPASRADNGTGAGARGSAKLPSAPPIPARGWVWVARCPDAPGPRPVALGAGRRPRGPASAPSVTAAAHVADSVAAVRDDGGRTGSPSTGGAAGRFGLPREAAAHRTAAPIACPRPPSTWGLRGCAARDGAEPRAA
jgi:hypothetical protein